MADLRRLGDVRDRLAGIRVVYTDLDGTMLGASGSFLHDPDGRPTLDPARALLAAQGAGIDVVPASGRALRGLLTDARMLGLQNVIAEMGALIGYGFGRRIVRNFGRTPADEYPVPVMERTGAIDLVLRVYEGRLEFHAPWHQWRECSQLFRGLVDPEEVNALLEAEGHGWVGLHDNGRLRGEYLGLPKGAARVYHLQPKGVSKGTAIALDRAERGLPKEACIAIGDSVADLAMAPEVGLFVLVADALQGDPELAQLIRGIEAACVTDRPQNLGWAETLEVAAAAAG